MYYYNNELPPQQGWVCPKCGRVNAPWMPTCGCVSSQTSGTPYLVETSSISRDGHEIDKTENCSEIPNNCTDCTEDGCADRHGCKTCRYGEVDEGYVRCAYYSKSTEQDEQQTERSE